MKVGAIIQKGKFLTSPNWSPAHLFIISFIFLDCILIYYGILINKGRDILSFIEVIFFTIFILVMAYYQIDWVGRILLFNDSIRLPAPLKILLSEKQRKKSTIVITVLYSEIREIIVVENIKNELLRVIFRNKEGRIGILSKYYEGEKVLKNFINICDKNNICIRTKLLPKEDENIFDESPYFFYKEYPKEFENVINKIENWLKDH